ncbi:MAG: CHAT domain-containing tetratricopeptide repeat protein [Vicinamibacterales bacterium]
MSRRSARAAATLVLAVRISNAVLGVSTCAVLVLARATAGAQPSAPSTRTTLDAKLDEAQAAVDAGRRQDVQRLAIDAKAAAQREGNRAALARAIALEAWAYWSQGDFSTSERLRTEAIALAREARDLRTEVMATRGLAQSMGSQGRAREALDVLERVLPLSLRLEDPHDVALTYTVMGGQLGRLSEFARARSVLRRALEAERSMPDGGRGRVWAILTLLGAANRALGDLDDAVAAYRQSLEDVRIARNRIGEYQALGNLGNLYTMLGDYERALASHRESLSAATAADYVVGIATAHRNIAELLAALDRPQQANEQLQLALDQFRAVKSLDRLTDALVGRANLELRSLHRPDQAAAAAEEALALARSMGSREGEAGALVVLGRVASLSGDAAAARARFDAALAIARRMKSPETEYDALVGRADAARAGGRAADAMGDYRAAVEISRTLRAGLSSNDDRAMFGNSWREAHIGLATLLASLDRQGEALEAAEAGRARALADALASRHDAEPDAAGPARTPASVPAPSLADMTAVARRLDATVVEYLVAGDTLEAWVLAPTGTVRHAAERIDKGALRALAADARRAVDLAAVGDTAPAAKALATLHRRTIAPIARWLPTDPESLVVIVADDVLQVVPFGALVDERGRPVVASHTLSYAPSIGVLLESGGTARRSGPDGAVVAADPTPPPDAPRDPLPGARLEADEVARRAGGRRVETLLGANATETALKAAAPGADWLHVAAHASVSPDRPMASAIVLAPSADDDGYLRVDEIVALRLAADLVVLSGCSTGLGRVSSDGIAGLTGAFLSAGARTIVTSLWDVSDDSTAFLMARFYEGLQAGRSKASALRRAQLATRARYAHPGHWAAFQLTGEPR